jgi:hypothetical protein
LYKKRRKTWHFLLFKRATWGVTLWHFHIYVYCSLIWFMSSIFLLFTLVPFNRFTHSIFIFV